jgi:hypothetical protein
VVKIEQKKILMNHRNETFGSGFSESGSAGFAATYCFLKREIKPGTTIFGGTKKEVRGEGQLYTHRESIHFRRCFHYKKRKREKKELAGLKGII